MATCQMLVKAIWRSASRAVGRDLGELATAKRLDRYQ